MHDDDDPEGSNHVAFYKNKYWFYNKILTETPFIT